MELQPVHQAADQVRVVVPVAMLSSISFPDTLGGERTKLVRAELVEKRCNPHGSAWTRPLAHAHIQRMTIPHSFAPARLYMAITVAAFAACGSSTPRTIAHDDAVHIVGEFLVDGSCQVTVDGTPLYSESEKPRTIYLRARALNMAPAGFDMHEIWCAPITAGEPMLPDRPDQRAFFINVYAPSGKLAIAQHYLVMHGLPKSSGSATAIRANVSLFGHNPTARRVAADHLGTTYLAGTAGDVILTRVDSTGVIGTFRALALPELTML